MVWIGLAEEDEGKTVRPVAQAGFEEGYLETFNITWADTERGRGPTGTTIRTGQPGMCRNMQAEPGFAPWRAEAIERGFASSLALPLLGDGRAFGALTIYSRQPEGFSDAEVKLLSDLAADMAYGITALRMRAAKTQAEQRAAAKHRGPPTLQPRPGTIRLCRLARPPGAAAGGWRLRQLLQHRFPDKLDAKARGYMEGAFEGAMRMERLITDLLAFSRVGTRGGEFAPADLEAVLGQALRNLEAGIQSAQATVTHNALPTLCVDATRMNAASPEPHRQRP